MAETFSLWRTTVNAFAEASRSYFEPLIFLVPEQRSKFQAFRAKHHQRIDSLLGEDTEFTGDLTCSEKGIRIDGHWRGNVNCIDGTVVLSRSATLDGSLATAFAVIGGTVRGDVIATSAVEILGYARIEGNVTAPVVEMHSGAAVRGRVETSEIPGSEVFIELQGTVREIAEQAPRVRLVK